MATFGLRIADCGLRNEKRRSRRYALAPNPYSLAPRRRRSGVILLVAMALLALFSVVVLTFVIVARQHKQSAEAMLQGKYYDLNYEEHLSQAAMQIIRGTNNPLSVIGPHGVLEDLYGPPSLFGTVGTVTQPASGPLYTLTITVDAASPARTSFDDYYNGCVLTLYAGSGEGGSFRVLDYDGGSGDLTVLNISDYVPAGGEDFLINGRPFSGAGFGLDPSTFASGTFLLNHPFPYEPFTDQNSNGIWDMGEPFTDKNGDGVWTALWELAMRPNPRGADWRTYLRTLPVHANEDYDAPDYQNMILAMRLADSTASNSVRVPSPSLHRPELIQYWIDRQGAPSFAALTPTSLKREILLRPISDDHPTFTSSVNPGFDPLDETTWDVDNDGDFVPDSIWVDLGLPVQTAPDGRQYKPLFAVMCIDMDGKLNINVHGQLNDWNNDAAEISGTFHTNPQSQVTVLTRPANLVNPMPSTPPYPELAGTLDLTTGARRNATLPAGLGFGPQEINISTAVRSGVSILVDDVQFRQLLRGMQVGSAALPVEGRYGEGHRIDPDTTTARAVLAGETGVDYNLPTPISPPNGMSPPDFDGNGVFGLSPTGHPYFYYMGPETNGVNAIAETTDEAAEFDPTRRRRYLSNAMAGTWSNSDNPFTPAELEAALRTNDVDSSILPGRIAELAPMLSVTYNRARMTTESWDIPCPNFVPTPEIASGLAALRAGPPVNLTIGFGNLGIIDLVRGKIKAANPTLPLTTVNTRVNALIAADVIAPELLAGLRINLNRAFGASNNDPVEKARLARHLYFLMLLLKDQSYALTRPTAAGDTQITSDPMANIDERRELTAQQLAQWAINVVDFRDADATMTPFEYVIDPFSVATGWNIDNQIMASDPDASDANRRVVWGHEDSGLIITETKAFHDVRLRDTDQEVPNATDSGKFTTDTMMPDLDYDSVRIPEGSLFVELFCTANPSVGDATTKRVDMRNFQPSDLYSGGQLQLGKMSFNGTGINPVWRLAITEAHSAATNPTMRARMEHGKERDLTGSLEPVPYPYVHPDPVPLSMRPPYADPSGDTQPAGWKGFSVLNGSSGDEVKIERVVWFCTTPPTGTPGDSVNDKDNIYYNQVANPVVSPGQYAVVGPYRNSTGPWWMPRTPPAPAPGGPPNLTAIGAATGAAPPTITLNTGNTPPTVKAVTNPPLAAMSDPYDVTKIRNAVPIACAGIRPTRVSDFVPPLPTTMMYERTPSTFQWTIGLSVSEPLFSSEKYYRLPTDDTTPTQHSTTPATIVYDRYKTPQDQPEDARIDSPANQAGLSTDTVADYRTVFLQRLADPSAEWNAVTNPYITIDWMPIDLTIFNGAAAEISPTEKPLTLPMTFKFSSRERGQVETDEGAYNLYSQRFDDSNSTRRQLGPQGRGSFYFNLDHTFGYLNEPFHDATATNPWLYNTNDYNDPDLKGSPNQEFPWLAWNNRPYASHLETMNVPATRSARLYWDFNVVDEPGSYPYGEHFYAERTSTPTVTTDKVASRPSTPYGHLLNFFFSAHNSSVPATQNISPNDKVGSVSNYYRVFDYLHVPSRFSGSEWALDPSSFTPPNDRLSRYREPGRVNINTIPDKQELSWLGVTNSFNSDLTVTSGAMAPWAKVGLSLNQTLAEPFTDSNGNGVQDTTETFTDSNGNGSWDNGFMSFDGSLPTMYPNLFRSFGNANYVPLAELRSGPETFTDGDADGEYDVGETYTDSNGNGIWDRGEFIDGTLFRRSPEPVDSKRPLFSFRSNPSSYDPLGSPLHTGEFNDSDRNAYFRYLMYQKMGNILTTRSNVYAVWVTVGYFEVQRTAIDAGNPDGYELLGELSDVDGNTVPRHKSFFIMDRSIPVAFSRGKNYNVHKAILLHRIIE